MRPRAFQIHAADNVAVLMEDAPAGPIECEGEASHGGEFFAGEPIARGHKIALVDIGSGEAVLKYGQRIGHATRPIARGAWVHLHNLASDYDERSSTLDNSLGAPIDTASAYV